LIGHFSAALSSFRPSSAEKFLGMVNVKSIAQIRKTGVKKESLKATFLMVAKDSLLEKADLEISFFPGTQIEVISFDID
jgi:hypothetical protein